MKFSRRRNGGAGLPASRVIAWADGDISGTALLAAVWAAAQACFIRAGIANEVQKANSGE